MGPRRGGALGRPAGLLPALRPSARPAKPTGAEDPRARPNTLPVVSLAAYAALFALAAISWVGVPGTGESALIAAGVVASRHDVLLAPVLLCALAGGIVGGQIGYAIGRRAGRPLLGAAGPLASARRRALDRGEALFARHGRTAALLAPTWVSGATHLPVRTFSTWNAVAAAIWATVVGVGAFLVGPRIQDALNAFDDDSAIIVSAAIAAAGAVWLWRHARRRRAAG